MPMIDIQRRHQTIFRIRFGEQIPDKKSKTGFRPVKFTDAIRVTSANPDVVDAFIDVYGGTREPWENQFEAKLPTTALNILVLPGQSVSQWWEKYTGSVCQRRCDGARESKANTPCMCDPDVEVRTADRNQCSPTTRVSVICPDVAVVGSGMFVCHGLVGAETLPQSIAVAEAALSRGLMVPAVLRVVEFKGRNHFIVPQIEVVGMSFNALTAAATNGELQHATGELGQTKRELEAPAVIDVNSNPRFTPIEAPAAPPAPRIADQFGEFATQSAAKQEQRGQRARAAAPIPATGVIPRGTATPPDGGASEAAGVDGAQSPSNGNAHAPSTAANNAEGKADTASVSGATADPSVETVNDDGAQMIGMWCADHGIGDDLRPALLYAFSGGAYHRAHDVPVDKIAELRATLLKVKRGDLVLDVPTVEGVEPKLRVPGDSAESAPSNPPPASVTWRAVLGEYKGIGQAKLLRRARDLAGAMKLPLPTSLDDIDPALNEPLRVWLDEQAAA